jgi:hypothetical protein
VERASPPSCHEAPAIGQDSACFQQEGFQSLTLRRPDPE